MSEQRLTGEMSGIVLRVSLAITLVLVSGISIVSARGDVALVFVALLGVMAVAPRLNPLVYWPLGLMAAVTIGYLGYLCLWWFDGFPVDPQFSAAMFSSLTALFGIVAIVRAFRHPSRMRWNREAFAVTVGSCALPVVLVVVATIRRESFPTEMFSAYMSGGDHGLHNEIIHNLLWWSSKTVVESPISLYGYPRGLHFMIANVISLTSDGDTSQTLAQEYVGGAWFEFVQLAAFIQLATVIYVNWSRRGRLVRVAFLPPIYLGFASIPFFVPHLLWSGFTTSTGMAWGLLVPIALWVGLRLVDETARHIAVMTWAWLSLLGYSWIVYQPYVIPVAILGPLWLLMQSEREIKWRSVASILVTMRAYPVISVIVTSGLVSASPYFVLGRDSPGISSLFLDGSTRTPSLTTVILWALVALGTAVGTKHRELDIPRMLLAALVGFTVAMTAIVFLAGDDPLLAMPYYIQKMYWVVWYVSTPLVLGIVGSWVADHKWFRGSGPRLSRYLALWIAVALIPFVQGRVPNNALTHFSVDWFARGVFSVEPRDTENNGAFSMRDQLGSHMANLALRSASTTFLTPDVAISGNPYLACRDIRESQMTRVYTTPNGRAEMFESGCPTGIEYVEDGVTLQPVALEYFEIGTGIERFTNKSPGFRLLLRGFLPPEKWGTWAGGYRSALGFRYRAAMTEPRAEITVRRDASSWAGKKLIIHANDKEMATLDVGAVRTSTFTVPLPPGERGTSIELTMTCERTTEEILNDDPVDGPSRCVGLESLRVFDAG